MSDSLTLVLDGQISLTAFSRAARDFAGLVDALSREVGSPGLEWLVANLSTGSAVATVRGVGEPSRVAKVVDAYEAVGDALEQWRPVPFSPAVQKWASDLTSLIDGEIESIRFETDRRDALIRRTMGVVPEVPERKPGDALGAVEGVVETLSRRGGLRFTLYDTVLDKAVSCYIAPGRESVMRDAWGRRAVVSGRVHRDPLTGRALSVRHVTGVEVVPEGKRGDWRAARAAAPSSLDSVEAVRKVRDG